ncbi:MAG: hypothetical protein ACE5E5_09770 [Phycisphaerae bacterium]
MNELLRGGSRRRAHRGLWLSLIAGTVFRLVVVLHSSPEFNLPGMSFYGWPADHGNYVQWGRQAASPDAGLLTVYTQPPDPGITVRLSFGESFVHHGESEPANYPPLGMYIIYLCGKIHRWLDPDIVANTAVARLVYQTAALIGDIILALGVWRLVGLMLGRRAGGVAFHLVFWMPPIWLDSSWWGQTDSWIMAPAVWIVWALATRRYGWAGVLWGLALALKPQAILLAPVWVFCGVVRAAARRHEGAPGSRADELLRWGSTLLVALAVVNIVALPFWFTSGDAWLQQSFLRNLRDEGPFTTLKAFNIWYVDLLLCYDANVHATLWGLEKDSWGKLLALAGLALCALIAWPRRTHRRQSLVVFAGLWLLAVVMLPTRVHERYLVMCLPFLIALVPLVKRLRAPLCGLLIVATAQVLVYHWMPLSADAWTRKFRDAAIQYHENVLAQTPPELLDQVPTRTEALALGKRAFIQRHWQRTARWEWAVTILALASAGGVFAALSSTRRPRRPAPAKTATLAIDTETAR